MFLSLPKLWIVALATAISLAAHAVPSLAFAPQPPTAPSRNVRVSSFLVRIPGRTTPSSSQSLLAPPSSFGDNTSRSRVVLASFFAEPTPADKPTGPKQQIDGNDTEILPGAAVRISKPNIKAFGVPKTAYGTFDPDTKEFVKGEKCLVLPVGLEGTVSKVYDTNEFDRTHPVLVKFKTSEPGEGGFVSPKTFMMHFESREIECVEVE